jgi:hypothetical protein
MRDEWCAATSSRRRGCHLLVADIFRRDRVNRIFGDIRSMIAHPF